jgi:Ni/Co efflux regulator RcnB
MKAFIVLAAVVLATAATAAGQQTAGSDDKSMKSAEAKFESLDRDRDRALDKREAKADASIAAQFNSMDINLDGYVSRSEYLASLERAARPQSPRE